MKNKSVIALMLAFTMSFTSVCPALAAVNTAVESEEVTESEPEEVSEENAVPAEETAPEEQNVSGADEAVMDASSGNQTEPVETTEVTGDTEEITDETANATEETENVTDEAADAAEESKDGTDETTGVAVVDGTTEEYSKKAGEAAAEPEFTGTITITVEGQTAVPDNSGDESPEDLFEQYMSVEFGLSGRSSMRKAKKATGTRLEGNDLAVYQAVARELPAIAAGERASTEFELTLDDFGVEKAEWTAEELGVSSVVVKDEQGNITGFSQEAKDAVNAKISFDLHKVSTALLADFPYDLYWFNKSIEEAVNIPEYSTSASTDGNGEWVIILPESITLRFKVAGEFSGADEYTVNTEVGQSVQTAVNNANDIIEQHSGDADEDKLHNYKDAICNLVSYNDDAAAGNFDFNYGNPWQLLWVFDGIEETKVVCEGYSKAFKYLCDKSSLACILVTGTMDGGKGAGNHMWNIVKLGDKNYLVDVTNCDEGTIGAPDQLFLKREAELNIDNGKEIGYTFHLGGSSVAYSYDEDTLNYYEQNEISLGELQHEHTLVETPAKAATCTEEGNIRYWTCSECRKIFSDEAGETEINLEATVVPVKAHTLTHVEANAATCTDTGNKEHWKCSVCGALFSDEEGTTPTTAEVVEIAATGHTLAKVDAMAATCTDTGNKEHWKCSVCGALFSDALGTTPTTAESVEIAATGHDLTETEAKAATCTEDGNIAYWTCGTCGKLFKDSEGTQEISQSETVVAAGHDLSKTEEKAATCTEAGNIEYWTCGICKKLFSDAEGTTEINEKDTVVAATGHAWGEWTEVKPATEEEEGLAIRTCSNDESHKEERTIHSLEKTEAKDATCTEAGNIEYWTCGICKKLFKDSEGTQEISQSETVVAAGHDLSKTEAKAATCTEAGNIAYWTCGTCGKIFSDEKGETEISQEETVVAAEGHNLTKTEAKDATCTEAGNIEYWTCSKCEKLYSDEAGTKEITQKDTVAAAKGHSWSGWTVTKKATCTENGSQVRTCSVCKEEETGVIKATGHKWNTTYTVDKKPTASSNGSKSIHCSVCGSIKPGSVQSIPRLTGSWIKDSTGWWYRWSDGTYPAGKFENIGGKTYYFNKAGYMVTGWQYIGGKWYYFDENGAMTRGWLKQGGTWYYLNGSGVMVTGLQNIGGVRYYFNGSGAMQTGWQYIGGKWYYFDGSGAMTRGWLKQGGTWYYLNGSGVMVTGWQNIGGVRYYFNGSGAMQTGWQYIGGKWYYFNGDGAMQTGWRYLGGTWYYMNGSGIMVTGWQQIGGVWYYFNGSGAMQTDWQYIGGKWFYFDGSGAMVTNKWVGDYYLTGSGAMATNTWIGSYYVGADGKWIPGYGARSSSGSSSANASSGIVYWVSGGSVYHSTDRCPALGRSNPSSIMHGTIAESGKPRPCKDCY